MKKIVLLTTSLIVVATIMLSIKKQPASNPVRTDKEPKEGADARGMIAYFSNIMVDPATGQMDLKAYYTALEQAKAAIASRSTNGTALQWQFLGPDNIGGRTRAILFDRNHPGRVFAAGVSGGLWISNTNGYSWSEWSGSDQLASMNIVSICQDANGNVYFGTGEGLYGNYGIFGGGFPGDGMWKSNDTVTVNPAQNLQFTHLTSTTPTPYDPVVSNIWSDVNRIAADPHFADSLFAATEGGIMCSANGGTSWTRAATIPLDLPAEDVKYSIDGKKVFAAVGGFFYYSKNAGVSFTKISGADGFPTSNGIERIEIAVSLQTPNYAYATLVRASDLSVSSVVRTTDGGLQWSTIGTGSGWSGDPYTLNGFDPTGDQGDYDLATAVSPVDSNIVFVGGIVLWRWTQTSGWLQISNYGIDEFNTELHSDLHALVFDPTNGSRLVIGCDGGVNQTLDPYNNATNELNGGVLYSTLDSGYNVTQYYSMSADSAGHLIGGTQDNGNQFINFTGNTVQSANIVVGGDGGCTQVALSNNQIFFTQVALGQLLRSSTGGNGGFNDYRDSILIAAMTPYPGPGVGAPFYTPFNLWENLDSFTVDHNAIPQRAVQSLMAVGLNSGEVWVTPDALNLSSTTWYRLQNVSDGGTITAVKFSKDGKFLYVGTGYDPGESGGGHIYRYTGFDSIFIKHRWSYPEVNNKTKWVWNAADSGISVIQSTYANFNGRSVLSFAIDPADSNHMIATCGNYGTEYTTWVAISQNAEDTSAAGFTFNDAPGTGSGALPPAPVYSSCITHGPNSLILVGTPVGVWSTPNNGASPTWAPNNTGLANVTVMSIKELPYYNTYALYAGTHGRGMFSTINPDSPTGINTTIKGQTVNSLTVFPNPLTNTGHIQYTLAKEGNVIINLYNIDGKLVKVIANENMIAGPIDIQFNVANLVSGTYIMQVVEGQYQATKKLVVLH